MHIALYMRAAADEAMLRRHAIFQSATEPFDASTGAGRMTLEMLVGVSGTGS